MASAVSYALKAAVALALLSFFLAALVLAGLYGINPLQLSVIDRLADASTSVEEAEAVQAVTGISVAMSTVVALVLATLALVVLIVTERSETRAIEQLKLDIASLASTLAWVHDRATNYSTPRFNSDGSTEPFVESVNHSDPDPFLLEREALTRILTSSTGLAIHSWSSKAGNEKYVNLFADVGELVNVTTLKLDDSHTPEIIQDVAQLSKALFDRVCSIHEPELKTMSRALSRLSDGLDQSLIGSLRTAISYPAPTDEQLTRLIELADRSIGGAAGETIEHFGRSAMEGSGDDRRAFYLLVQQLGLPDLVQDDVPETAYSDTLIRRKFQHVKQKGVVDPNVDMFIAVFDNDTDALRSALEAGADTSITDVQVLAAYEAELSDFRP